MSAGKERQWLPGRDGQRIKRSKKPERHDPDIYFYGHAIDYK
jgi:hypothetical protein